MEWILIKTLLSLAGVIGLMIALMLVLKKYVSPGKGGASAIVEVEILGQRSLQPKRSVFVLKVLNKVVVVGMTEHGMQALTEIEDPEALASVEERLGARPPASRWMTWNLHSGPAKSPMTFARHLQKCAEAFLRKKPASSRQQPLV